MSILKRIKNKLKEWFCTVTYVVNFGGNISRGERVFLTINRTSAYTSMGIRLNKKIRVSLVPMEGYNELRRIYYTFASYPTYTLVKGGQVVGKLEFCSSKLRKEFGLIPDAIYYKQKEGKT